MPMEKAGLVKLVEECGELVQIAAKKMAYFNTDIHPDGGLPMSTRLEDEIGDVYAASLFIAEKLGLDQNRINRRAGVKLAMFRKWDKE